MNSLNRKELFKKTKCSLVGKKMHIVLFLSFVVLLIYYLIIQDKGYTILSIVAVLLFFNMLIIDNTIPYFLDLICLKYKGTNIVIENKGIDQIDGIDKFDAIGSDRKITCIDEKKFRLRDYKKINVKIPELKSENQYKLVYLKYSKIIIDSIIISSEVPKKEKNRKRRR